MPIYEELKVFAGTSNPDLARAVCEYLDVPMGQIEVFKFSNDNTFVRINENVRQRDVFLVQGFSYPVNDNLMELLIMIDAAKRASAGRITAVIPYYGYGRTDKKDQPRVPINIPVDELTALPILARYFAEKQLPNPVVVAVDIGISKRARDLAERLGVPLAIVEKRRVSGNHDKTELLNIIGDVGGMTAILMDDEVDTGGSMVGAAEALIAAGATKVFASSTHAVLSGNAVERFESSPIEELVCTDTIPLAAEKHNGQVKIISIAALFGEAIHRIHFGLSVGAMFDA
jgi:ribose-phosphate pyrophosphokinase